MDIPEEIERYIEIQEEMKELAKSRTIQRWIVLLEEESHLFKKSWKVRKHAHTGAMEFDERDEWNPERNRRDESEEKLFKLFLREREGM